MRKTFYFILVALITVSFLSSCAPQTSLQKTQEEPNVTASPLPTQAAAAFLPNGKLPKDNETFTAFRAELDKKLAETRKDAESLGLSEDYYYRAIMDNTIPLRLEMMIDSEELELAKRAEIAVFQWSELHDFAKRMNGYVGILRVLCEGDDMFNMRDDALNLTDNGAWPSGYFFDEYLPPLERVDSFIVCDEYLDGYGMDDALLCSIGSGAVTLEEAGEYIDVIKAKGLYTYSENRSKTKVAWYGCWVGDDGQNCYLYVERSPINEGSILQQLSGNNEFFVLAGNFDFMLCIEVAMWEYLL